MSSPKFQDLFDPKKFTIQPRTKASNTSDQTKMMLAVNCGSSSIKFKLFAIPQLDVLVSGEASEVVTKGVRPKIRYMVPEEGHEEKASEEGKEDMPYDEVFERILVLIEQSASRHFLNHSRPRDLIRAVAHRVVHGGSETKPMEIYPGHEEGLEGLEVLNAFAPLHNVRAVQVVKSCLSQLPNSHQILLFDTLFHSTLPEHIYTYPISKPEQDPPIPLRKYGAHGLSYASILRSMAQHLGKAEDQLNLVIAHLGSGASVCAIKRGKSLDTSMGLTPLDGLPGGTRTGSVDPVLIFHHTPSASETVNHNDLALSKGEMIMNKQGGLQAVAGISNFETITSNLSSTDLNAEDRKKSQLAYDLFLDRLLNYLGSYVLKICGSSDQPSKAGDIALDGIVFSGGIGQHSAKLRADVGRYFAWLGCQVNETANDGANDGNQVVTEITKGGSKVKIFACLTDEETQCARMAMDVLRARGAGDGEWD